MSQGTLRTNVLDASTCLDEVADADRNVKNDHQTDEEFSAPRRAELLQSTHMQTRRALANTSSYTNKQRSLTAR